MVPWVEIDRAKVPGGDELRLMQRGAEFSIMAGAIALMSSRIKGSEEALARLAADRIGARPKASVLIGGLGMGFTLRAAQAALGKDAKLVVAELVPTVIAWARGPLRPVFGDCLDDPRVSVIEGDVSGFMAGRKGAYDAILLDVDNGPSPLTRDSNEAIYGMAGLSAARTALKPGGVLAVWSAEQNPAFTKRLVTSGFAVEEVKVRANGSGGGARHRIWVATRPGGASAAA